MNRAAARDRLYHEVERLTEQLRLRLSRDGDDEGQELIRQREEILSEIREIGGPSREDAGALQRIVELNDQVLALLEVRKARIRQQLAMIALGRQSLGSYRGPSPVTAAFLDRMS